MGRIVIVCGGRDYGQLPADRALLVATLDHEHARDPIEVIHEGGASGADALARRWAFDRNVQVRCFPALWSTHGKRAGPIRNEEMAAAGADLVLAFPGGRGTVSMIGFAHKHGIPVVTVR